MVLPISVQKKQNLPPFRALSAKAYMPLSIVFCLPVKEAFFIMDIVER